MALNWIQNMHQTTWTLGGNDKFSSILYNNAFELDNVKNLTITLSKNMFRRAKKPMVKEWSAND